MIREPVDFLGNKVSIGDIVVFVKVYNKKNWFDCGLSKSKVVKITNGKIYLLNHSRSTPSTMIFKIN